MLSAEERLDKIARLASFPSRLEATIRNLSDGQMDTPYREGGWTVRQVVHHLADSHMNAFIRAKLIVTENNPTLKPYNQDHWVLTSDVRGFPVQSSLWILRGLHERWAALLKNLSEDAWGRTAHHPERGTVTLEGQLTIYTAHGDNHIGQIAALRAERGW